MYETHLKICKYLRTSESKTDSKSKECKDMLLKSSGFLNIRIECSI